MIGKNNPLNIRTSGHYKWIGQDGETRGFCNFDDVIMCRRAGAYLLMRSYRRAHCQTLAAVISRWAPAKENDTVKYIQYVSARTGLNQNMTLVFDSDFASVLAAMEIFEQGIDPAKRETYYANARASYLYVINEFNLKCYEG